MAYFQHSVFKQLARKSLKFNTNLLARKCSSQHVQVDVDYLTNPSNESEIRGNIKERKGVGCIDQFKSLFARYEDASSQTLKTELWEQLTREGLKIPNRSDPVLLSYGDEPQIIETRGHKPVFPFRPKELHEITKQSGTLRTENLGIVTGHRSYYFLKELALLEQALIRYTVDVLKSKGFVLYSVPDLLSSEVIESCGMDTKGERTQVCTSQNIPVTLFHYK